MTSTDVALHSWPTAKWTAEWWGVQTYCTAPSMLNLQFLTETLQVRTFWTLSEQKSRHLTLWLSSALRVPMQFPSFLRWSTCLIWSTKSFPLCDGTTPNPTWCHKQPLSICNVELLLFGEEKGEKGAAPLTLQSRCEGGKTRVLIGLQVSDRQNSICKRRSFGLRYRYS